MAVSVPKRKKGGMDWIITIPTLVVVLIACALIVSFPDQANNFLNKVFSVVTGPFGWCYILFVIATIILSLWFIFGRYAHCRLGKEKPDRSTFSWLALMFGGATSASIIYWAMVEFFFYLEAPPFNAEPFSNQAYTWASTYGSFHWGVFAFAMYAVMGVLFGFMLFEKKVDSARISTACVGVIGEKNARGVLGKVIDAFFLFSILLAMAGVTLGLSMPLVGTLFERVFGIPHTLLIEAVLILVITVLFTISVYTGLQKGMKYVADTRITLGLLLLAYIFIVGPTGFILNNTLQSIGTQLQYAIQMITYTDVTGGSGFPQSWTIFYFAWFLSTALYNGIYYGRISKGRTVRQTALGIIVSNALACMMFFWVMGNYSMDICMQDEAAFGAMMAQEPYDAIIYAWNQLPLGNIVAFLFFCFAFLSTWTAMQGSSFSLAMVAEKNLTGDEEPGKVNRIFWCLLLGVLALALLFLGGLQTVKNAGVLSSVPAFIICVIVIVGLLKDMNAHWGPGTRVAAETQEEISE